MNVFTTAKNWSCRPLVCGPSARLLLGWLLFAGAVFLNAPRTVVADERIPADAPLRWWKGNLHTHTLWSDGDDFPEMVAEWYRTHGYHFLALSDHNVLSEGQRWMSAAKIAQRGGDDVIAKYRGRFGDHWVETRTDADGALEYRLKPLDEFRPLVEERGQFLMLVGEEISDSVAGAPLHLNATNLRDLLQPLGGDSIPAALRANLRAAEDQAKRLGREIVVHLNHPNFHYAIRAEHLAEVVEEQFFEVYNGHPGVNHLGDAEHPGTEPMWDIANVLRLLVWHGPPLLGIATDDSHAYHRDEGATPGRGWTMVRARHLTPESLVRAMKAGECYASSGVTLQEVAYDAAAPTLTVQVAAPPTDAAAPPETYKIDFVGSRRKPSEPADSAPPQADPASILATVDVGVCLASHQGTEASYTLRPGDLYVRAVVTASTAHPNRSFAGQRQQAWTQPVGWQPPHDRTPAAQDPAGAP